MADPPLLPDDRNPHPQIQQDLKGDRNQAIGQAIDSTIVNFAGDGQVINLTINDRIPTASLPPSNIVVQKLTQQEYRQRQVLLNKVRDAWVKGVLEKSLHARVSIELGLQERPDLVQQTFSDVAEFAAAPGQALPEGTPATTVFDRMGSGRTLLIVGEPGSGKTIALLKLAEDAIDRTEPDLRQQIPVVFNLSSWARKPQSIEQWLIQELLEKYQVSKALGKTWVESEALMLLLDGLDEVKTEQRNACVQALNQFMQTHGTTEIVICCRIGDYQMLQDRLMLRSAICLQPLTAAQIDRYFEQAGDRLSALKAVLPQDAELQELAKSPLMLSVMSLAYQDFTPEQLTVGGKIEDYRKRLFATYIDRMFQRRGTTQQYSREDSQRWLIWLAQWMKFAAHTVFSIDKLQPSWFPTRLQQRQYRFVSASIRPLIFYLINLILFVFLNLLKFLLDIKISFFVTSGLAFEDIYLLFGILYYGVWMLFVIDFKLIKTLRWSLQETKNGIVAELISGLISIAVEILIYMLIGGTISVLISVLIPGLIHVTILGLTGWSICGFLCCLKHKSNQNVFSSIQDDIISGITIFMSFFLTDQLIAGIIIGLTSVLIPSKKAVIRSFSLRLFIYKKNYAPWNYSRFLDYATERLFLQKVGGGYIFIHRMLLEHFAEMSIEQEKR